MTFYENQGDNSFAETAYLEIPQLMLAQGLEIGEDLDQDGRPEILGAAGSWQSIRGAEPGRDASLP